MMPMPPNYSYYNIDFVVDYLSDPAFLSYTLSPDSIGRKGRVVLVGTVERNIYNAKNTSVPIGRAIYTLNLISNEAKTELTGFYNVTNKFVLVNPQDGSYLTYYTYNVGTLSQNLKEPINSTNYVPSNISSVKINSNTVNSVQIFYSTKDHPNLAQQQFQNVGITNSTNFTTFLTTYSLDFDDAMINSSK